MKRRLRVLTDQQGWLLAALEWLQVASEALDASRECCALSHQEAARRVEVAYRNARAELEERRYLLRTELAFLDRLATERNHETDPMTS